MSELWYLLSDNWLRFLLVGTGGLVVTAFVVAAVACVFRAAEKQRLPGSPEAGNPGREVHLRRGGGEMRE